MTQALRLKGSCVLLLNCTITVSCSLLKQSLSLKPLYISIYIHSSSFNYALRKCAGFCTLSLSAPSSRYSPPWPTPTTLLNGSDCGYLSAINVTEWLSLHFAGSTSLKKVFMEIYIYELIPTVLKIGDSWETSMFVYGSVGFTFKLLRGQIFAKLSWWAESQFRRHLECQPTLQKRNFATWITTITVYLTRWLSSNTWPYRWKQTASRQWVNEKTDWVYVIFRVKDVHNKIIYLRQRHIIWIMTHFKQINTTIYSYII